MTQIAPHYDWPVPSYSTVYAMVAHLDPGLRMLAHEGTKRYEEAFDLVYGRQSSGPNELWQADHTELDLWVITPSAKPGPPLVDRYRRRLFLRRGRLHGQLGGAPYSLPPTTTSTS